MNGNDVPTNSEASQHQLGHTGITTCLRRALGDLRPGSGIVLGAIIGSFAPALGYAMYLGSSLETNLTAFDTPLVPIVVAIGMAIVASCCVVLICAFHRIPPVVVAVFVAAPLSLVTLSIWVHPGPLITTLFTIPLIALGLILGALIGLAFHLLRISDSQVVFAAALALFVGSAVLGITAISWLGGEGSDAHVLISPEASPLSAVDAGLEDPSLPGPHETQLLFYASDDDPHRPQYGPVADEITPSLDLRPYLPEMSRRVEHIKRRFWGVDFDESPLNGRVWMPAGRGPFPLVLIVHGNHPMHRTPDAGYDYLGELLASRGFIAVSVDQTFLNAAWGNDDLRGRENGARARLLLAHLALWRRWQVDPTSTFFGKADMSRIALIGHSRGGEAASIATALNDMERFPDNANLTMDGGFSIRSVVAIAPSDSFFEPGGKPTRLEDVNYLTIHGGHDGDVSAFLGLRQFERVSFSGQTDDFYFKAAVYPYRANHGYFNTEMARRDMSIPAGWLLNTRGIMEAELQRKIAALYVSAFLETTLRDARDYLPIFSSPSALPRWLPGEIILHRYRDSSQVILADFEEDVVPTTASLPGAQIHAANLREWREIDLPLRARMLAGTQSNRAAILAWNSSDESDNSPSYYRIDIDGGSIDVVDDSKGWGLIFSVADLRTEADEPIDFRVILTAHDGNQVEASLGDYAAIAPPLHLQTYKIPALEKVLFENREIILQPVVIPMDSRAGWDTPIDPTMITRISLVFDLTQRGRIAIDEIGFKPLE